MLVYAPAASAAEAPVTAAAESLRTSWYPDEGQLTPQLLEGGGFGKLFDLPLQGQVYAQPLVSGNTLLAVTEDNWIYGIDPQSGALQWSRNVGVPWNASESGCTDLVPHIGITGTPVIDPATNIAYFLSKTYASGEPSGPAAWDMHAVDLSNGNEEPGFPVRISGKAENLSGVTFDPKHQLQRPALLLLNGVVYAGFGSHCDYKPYEGWIVGVSTSAQITTMWATAPEGSAVWQAGGGLVSDGEGQILFSTGNGTIPPPGPGESPPEGSLGESVVRAIVQPDGSLKATDFFSPYNNAFFNGNDLDLGSGAPMALPSEYFGTEALPHLLVEVGKPGVMYLLNRDHLGGMGQGPENKDDVVQEIPTPHGMWGSLAVWPGDGGYIYIPESGALEVVKYSLDESNNPHISLVAGSSETFAFGSGSPLVTSDGTTAGSGIVWISRCPADPPCTGSTLNAYAAVPVEGAPKLLWSEEIGVSTKFARPEAANGRIYVGTRDDHLLAFGATHHTLAVVREGSGGDVSSNVPGIECGTSCSYSFADGTQVSLTATPHDHFEFKGWSGGGCSGTGACNVTMYSDTTVTATFAPITHTVTFEQLAATKITRARINRRKRQATFRFSGVGTATDFQCELIRPGRRHHKGPRATFSSCASPQRYRHLKPGRYTFEVRAVNSAGPDPTPATRRFRI